MKIIGTGYNSVPICGVFDNDEATKWLGALVDQFLREDIIIVDYGCGNGRLAHYISNQINDFEYIGIEIDSDHGMEMIKFAKEHFDDERTFFDLVGSKLEKYAIDSADLVVFGSVFTHTTIEDTYEILDRYNPVIKRGGELIFSALIKPTYSVGNSSAYHDDGFNVVYNTIEQYRDFAEKNNCFLSKVSEWNGGPTQHHSIFEMWRK